MEERPFTSLPDSGLAVMRLLRMGMTSSQRTELMDVALGESGPAARSLLTSRFPYLDAVKSIADGWITKGEVLQDLATKPMLDAWRLGAIAALVSVDIGCRNAAGQFGAETRISQHDLTDVGKAAASFLAGAQFAADEAECFRNTVGQVAQDNWLHDTAARSVSAARRASQFQIDDSTLARSYTDGVRHTLAYVAVAVNEAASGRLSVANANASASAFFSVKSFE